MSPDARSTSRTTARCRSTRPAPKAWTSPGARSRRSAPKSRSGKLYRGKVVTIKEFGCFVEVFPGQDGLVHISELANFRVKQTEDIVKLGDEIWVKCLGVDEKGRVRLSRRAAMEERDKLERDKQPGVEGGERPPRRPEADRPPRPEHRSERPDRRDRPGRGDRPDRGPRPDRGERPDRGPRPERAEGSNRGEGSSRGEGAERVEGANRGERPERGERPPPEDTPPDQA